MMLLRQWIAEVMKEKPTRHKLGGVHGTSSPTRPGDKDLARKAGQTRQALPVPMRVYDAVDD